MIPYLGPGFSAISPLCTSSLVVNPLHSVLAYRPTGGQGMSRGYFPEAPEFYRRPSRSLPMTMPNSEREPARPYSVAQRINRQSTPHEVETDRGGNQNRRRIAVAVSQPSCISQRSLFYHRG